MLYKKLRIKKWAILFSILVIVSTTIIGTSLANLVYQEGDTFFSNQLFTSFFLLLIIFLLGHPKEMFISSKVNWKKLKYAIIPLGFILLLPLFQGGYNFQSITVSQTCYMFSVGLAEELSMHAIAMGVMILAWGEDKKSLLKGAIIGSFLFGIFHLLGILEDPTNFSWVLFKSTTIFFAFLLSLGFAGLVYQTNTVWIAVLLHGIIDLTAGNIGSPEVLDSIFSHWSISHSIFAILYSLPFGLFGYWLLVKDFKKEKSTT